MPARRYRRLVTPPRGSFFLLGVRGADLNQNYVTDTVVFRSRFDLGGATPHHLDDVGRGAIATPNQMTLGGEPSKTPRSGKSASFEQLQEVTATWLRSRSAA